MVASAVISNHDFDKWTDLEVLLPLLRTLERTAVVVDWDRGEHQHLARDELLLLLLLLETITSFQKVFRGNFPPSPNDAPARRKWTTTLPLLLQMPGKKKIQISQKIPASLLNQSNVELWKVECIQVLWQPWAATAFPSPPDGQHIRKVKKRPGLVTFVISMSCKSAARREKRLFGLPTLFEETGLEKQVPRMGTSKEVSSGRRRCRPLFQEIQIFPSWAHLAPQDQSWGKFQISRKIWINLVSA